eukprot:PhM_4_TR16025/c0_g3_i1/m.50359
MAMDTTARVPRRCLATRSMMSSSARGSSPASAGTPNIVCVFPEKVCPYAKTQPLMPSTKESTTDLTEVSYTSLFVLVGVKTASKVLGDPDVPETVVRSDDTCQASASASEVRRKRTAAMTFSLQSALPSMQGVTVVVDAESILLPKNKQQVLSIQPLIIITYYTVSPLTYLIKFTKNRE